MTAAPIRDDTLARLRANAARAGIHLGDDDLARIVAGPFLGNVDNFVRVVERFPSDALPDYLKDWTPGAAGGGPETLVIEKQDGSMLWGYTEYTDIDGSQKKEPVTGTLAADDGVVLTEKATLWQGEYDDGALTFVVSWAKGEGNHGAFEMVMTKQ